MYNICVCVVSMSYLNTFIGFVREELPVLSVDTDTECLRRRCESIASLSILLSPFVVFFVVLHASGTTTSKGGTSLVLLLCVVFLVVTHNEITCVVGWATLCVFLCCVWSVLVFLLEFHHQHRHTQHVQCNTLNEQEGPGHAMFEWWIKHCNALIWKSSWMSHAVVVPSTQSHAGVLSLWPAKKPRNLGAGEESKEDEVDKCGFVKQQSTSCCSGSVNS